MESIQHMFWDLSWCSYSYIPFFFSFFVFAQPLIRVPWRLRNFSWHPYQPFSGSVRTMTKICHDKNVYSGDSKLLLIRKMPKTYFKSDRQNSQIEIRFPYWKIMFLITTDIFCSIIHNWSIIGHSSTWTAFFQNIVINNDLESKTTHQDTSIL